ncbi:MAG TPA: chalcone isomerase family protein [Burkholderiaceae bacterium]
MIRPSWRHPARTAASGARALGQGLLGMALIALAAFALLPSANAATGPVAITMENQTFPAQASVAGAPLQLNGVGLRAAFIYKVYLAGLYLPAKAATGADAMAQPGPKRVQVRMLVDGPSDEFAKAFTGGIAKRTPADQVAAMKDRIAAFDHTLRSVGKVHKGDVVDLDWLPSEGLAMRINGKPVGTPVPGADLYAAMLNIFVGDRPVDAKMKAGMLGAAS